MASGSSLPDLTVAEDFGGDWATYEEALWAQFRRDFLLSRPQWEGWDVVVDRKLGPHGREVRFWHLIEKGEPGCSEDERRPEYDRCERLTWIRYILEHPAALDARSWIEKTRKGTKVKIALPDFSYLIVLKQARDHFRLITAYPVDDNGHSRERLRREHARFGSV